MHELFPGEIWDKQRNKLFTPIIFLRIIFLWLYLKNLQKFNGNGSVAKPAYLVKSEAGNLALKLETELSSGKSKASSVVKPKMFK